MSMLILDRHRRKPVTHIENTNGAIVVHAKVRAECIDWIMVFPWLALAFVFFVLGLSCLFFYALFIAITQQDLPMAILGVFFGLGSIFSFVWFLGMQGYFFPFKATYAGGAYHLRNGMLRISLRTDPLKTKIVINPASSRGNYGYGASIKINGRWPLPFVPIATVGSRSKSRRKAAKLHEWLVANTADCQVSMHRMWEARKF